MLPAIVVSLCVMLRIAPHPANFAPVGATAVFAGRTLRPAAAVSLILVAMFVADAALAMIHHYPLVSAVTPFVYGGFVAQALLGHALRHRRAGAVAAAVLGACAFFVSSNFGVWVAGSMYPRNLDGFTACYVAALPFFGVTLAADVVWTVILSLAYRPLAEALSKRSGWVSDTWRDLPAIWQRALDAA